MTRHRNSNFGRGGAFICALCGRRTRQTGAQSMGSELCPECYELAGMDNYCNDNGATPAAAGYTNLISYTDRIAAKGGNVAAVVRCCEYLFKPTLGPDGRTVVVTTHPRRGS